MRLLWEGNRMKISGILWSAIILTVTINSQARAQDGHAPDLTRRIEALEDYVDQIHPTLAEYSIRLEDGLQLYTQQLEQSLQEYSRDLETRLDARFLEVDESAIILNVDSPRFQKIETNGGSFLISVDRAERREEGFRLHLSIGNINFADYRNFSLKIFWGSPYRAHLYERFEDWRQTLRGAEYTFQGKLMRGTWNNVHVDLIPATHADISYLECSMRISAVELEVVNP